MWIRTQCNRRLIDCHNLSIEKYFSTYIIAELVDHGQPCELGSYISKEKALEVLNQIEECMEKPYNLVFQMPKDDTGQDVIKQKNQYEYHLPLIGFMHLKKGTTEQELNEYMINADDCSFLVYLRYRYECDTEWEYSAEAAACSFNENICWLNDWWEGQQEVEYLAISKLSEQK